MDRRNFTTFSAGLGISLMLSPFTAWSSTTNSQSDLLADMPENIRQHHAGLMKDMKAGVDGQLASNHIDRYLEPVQVKKLSKEGEDYRLEYLNAFGSVIVLSAKGNERKSLITQGEKYRT